MTVDTIFSFLIGTIDPIAAVIIFWILFENSKIKIAPVWHRLGLALVACGLIAQTARDWYFLKTGISLHDNDVPFWAMKDLGIATLAFYYVWLRWCHKKAP